MSNKQLKVALVFFVLGFALRFTGAISPFHEMCHWALGTFGSDQVTAVTWSRTYFAGDPSNLTIGGAYFLEAILLTLLVMKWQNWFTAFWFGAVHALILWAPTSEDFSRVPGIIPLFTLVWLVTISLGWWRVVYRLRTTNSP